jgi:imidazole glycerol-phosphate synthase subunit HisF
MPTKKRLIFALLYFDGYFCQSRNFKCQKVGDYNWLFNNYNFSNISKYLDELILLNVNPKIGSNDNFLNTLEKVVENVFVPVAVGGGVDCTEKALSYMKSGADKIIINSLIRKNTNIIASIIDMIGSQSVIASIDYNNNKKTPYIFNWEDKTTDTGLSLQSYIDKCEELGFGEILLNSVEKDGTGFGMDIEMVKYVSTKCKLPIIAMGGAGKLDHFYEVYEIPEINAATTANLLNFMGESLPKTRLELINQGVNLAKFNSNS